jgi:hypothetical protein
MTNFEIIKDFPGDATNSWLGITAFWTLGKKTHSIQL